MKLQNKKELQEITTILSCLSSRIDSLAMSESKLDTDFKIHKALNVSFKELDAIRMMYLSMLGETSFTKKRLKEMDRKNELSIRSPQCWDIYI
jgi:hypothetical protein